MGIYFLRHFKSYFNDKDIISGRMDTDIIGNQEIIYRSDIPQYFDYAFCSSKKRCMNTLNTLPQNIIKRYVDTDSLIERNVGVLEGMRRSEAVEKYPNLFYKGKLSVDEEIPEGETIEEVKKRLELIVLLLTETSKDKNILVCSHNQCLKVLYSMLKGVEITNEYWHSLNFENGTVINIDDVIY